MNTEPVVVLLSGGLDSAVTACIANTKETEVYPITFSYGQRHIRELECAGKLSEKLKFHWPKTVYLPDVAVLLKDKTSLVAASSMKPQTNGGKEGEIPNTWVPQRNLLFLTYAFMYAEALGASKVYIGVNAVDYSGYPDCREKFIDAAEEALNLGRKIFVEEGTKIEIITPLIHRTKASIVETGLGLGVPFELTSSCYYGGQKACGLCDSCRIRLQAFSTVGIKDPIEYEVKGADYAR